MRSTHLFAAVMASLAAFLSPAAQAQDPAIAAAVQAVDEWDNVAAEEALSPACKGGSSEACWRLGLLYKNQYDKAKEARAQFLANCARKDGKSCYMLGQMALSGDGGERDEAQARTAYAKACDAGQWFGCTGYAGLLAQGDGGKQDKPGAIAAYERGCGMGAVQACYDAAMLASENSDSADYDQARALKNYGRACELGMSAACSAQASMMTFDVASPTPQQRRAVHALYAKACAGGDLYSCDSMLTAELSLP